MWCWILSWMWWLNQQKLWFCARDFSCRYDHHTDADTIIKYFTQSTMKKLCSWWWEAFLQIKSQYKQSNVPFFPTLCCPNCVQEKSTSSEVEWMFYYLQIWVHRIKFMKSFVMTLILNCMSQPTQIHWYISVIYPMYKPENSHWVLSYQSQTIHVGLMFSRHG